MAIDRTAAETALRDYAGLTAADAKALVRAVIAAAEQEALDLIAGETPVPSSVADARALRLKRICDAAGRMLRPREVEVVFRVPPATAAATARRMVATYPGSVERHLRGLVGHTATVTETGSAESGLRYSIYFDEPTALDFAYQLLQRRGLTRDVRVHRSEQTLDVPRRVGGVDVLQALGIDR
jgi:hypothetical protein